MFSWLGLGNKPEARTGCFPGFMSFMSFIHDQNEQTWNVMSSEKFAESSQGTAVFWSHDVRCH